APGDDGKCGTAQAYELRASATPITRANFASATPIAIAPPAAAGTAETRTFTPPAGALFHALRAIDEVGNKGPIASVGALDLRRAVNERDRHRHARAECGRDAPRGRDAARLPVGRATC